jgi:hypothetical protein
MRRLHSHEWEHLVKTKDDEIERLREDLELQRKIDLQIIAEKQQLRGNLSFAEEGLANYAQENERLRVALSDLHAQVEKFCLEQGEWEFYTGPALRALGRSNHDIHEIDLQKLVEAARSSEPQPGEQKT